MPDPLGDRVKQMSESDREGTALALLVSRWRDVVGTDFLGCGEILRRLGGDHPTEGVQAIREALSELGTGAKWPPTTQRLGNTLTAFRDRPIEMPGGLVAILGEFDTRTKVWKHKVAPFIAGAAGAAGAVPGPLHNADTLSEGGILARGGIPLTAPAAPAAPAKEESRETFEV